MAKMGNIHIGISGWRYKPWRGSFYPEDLPQRLELDFASRKLNSIEINGTFYSLQRPPSFAKWSASTPKDFVFSVKGARFITHMKKLKDVEAPLANFFAQGLLQLGPKLGPILWQLPPNFKFDPQRMDSFFAMLPRTHQAAADLGRQHDERLNGRTWLEVGKDRKLHHAVEIRNESFVHEEFIALLRKWRVELVKADTVEWPLLMDLTSNFVYCRLHGSEELYTSGYSDAALAIWADRVLAWSHGREVQNGDKASSRNGPKRGTRDVYVYFDNDAKVRAPYDAQKLHTLVDERM